MGDLIKEITTLQEENEELKDEVETLKEQLESFSEEEPIASSKIPFKVGHKYFIRTVTYHVTGKVKSIKGGFLVLTDAAWIASSGRFRQAIMDGTLDEVEPVEVDMYVNIASITDAFVWKHSLPNKQK